MIALAAPVFSQTAADNPSKDPSKPDDVSLLKQQIAEQQKQIEQLRSIVDQMKQKMDQSSRPATTTAAAPQPTVAPAQIVAPTTPNLGQVASTSPMVPKAAVNSSTSGDGNPVAATLVPPVAARPATQEVPPKEEEQLSPLQFHLGAATFTPVGFLDFTGVFRTHVAGGSIGTSFGSIPYGLGSKTTAQNLSEIRLSMQNSRIGFRTDADVMGAHVIGYMEADFLGTNDATNIAVTSNSNVLRARLYWVDIMKGGFELLGGQTWSLLTPGRVGISPLPADVFYSQDMDVNYQAGLFWGRIPELRLVFHPSKQVALAFALDNPDQYVGGSSGGSTITFPTALATAYASELDAAGATGTPTPNVSPDIIAKLAIDPVKQVHFEIGGVESNFKVWYPGAAATATAAAIPAATFTNEGGGGFLNFHVEIFKGFRLMTNNFWSDGGGRFIFGQAPDLVVNANGSVSPLHSASTVTGFEFTHKNTLIFGYYGGIYASRSVVIDTTGKPVGYGYTGSSSSQNRAIQEPTIGFNQAVFKHPKYGAVNIIGQYSYLTRSPWYTAVGMPKNAIDNMVFLNLRYTLPGSAPTIGKFAR